MRASKGIAIYINCKGGSEGRYWAGSLRPVGLLALLFLTTSGWLAAQPEEPLTLNPDVPLTYAVQAGDTLWDISTLFLQDPWRWRELWAGNPQVDNPHRIYPGDTLSLRWEAGEPRLVRVAQGDIKFSPSMRASPLDVAIPAISRQQIGPFLRQHRVVEVIELDEAPYIVAGEAGRLISGVGDTVYGKGVWQTGRSYRLVRRAEKLKDPITGEGLGIFVTDVGEARLQNSPSDEGVAALIVAEMREEIRVGDRLLPATESVLESTYQPQVPETTIDGAYMIAVAGGVTQIGALDIVVINRGARESLRVGDVLAIDHGGEYVQDPVTGTQVRLPDTQAGALMVFSVYERASFGLVLEAMRPLAVGDKLRNP